MTEQEVLLGVEIILWPSNRTGCRRGVRVPGIIENRFPEVLEKKLFEKDFMPDSLTQVRNIIISVYSVTWHLIRRYTGGAILMLALSALTYECISDMKFSLETQFLKLIQTHTQRYKNAKLNSNIFNTPSSEIANLASAALGPFSLVV